MQNCAHDWKHIKDEVVTIYKSPTVTRKEWQVLVRCEKCFLVKIITKE